MPAELDEVRRRIMQLEIEREALRKEKDKASVERLARLDAELTSLKAEDARLETQWKSEKEAIQGSRSVKEEVEQVRLAIEEAQRAGDYAKASELQYGKLPELERRLHAEDARLTDGNQSQRMLKEEVDEEDIAGQS